VTFSLQDCAKRLLLIMSLESNFAKRRPHASTQQSAPGLPLKETMTQTVTNKCMSIRIKQYPSG